jgi:hypothetical protein
MKKTLAVLFASALGILSFYGCSGKNPVSATNGNSNYALVSSYEDASSSDIAQDVAGFSSTLDFGSKGSVALAKKAATVTQTIQWQDWTYANNWWFRDGEITYTSVDGAVDLLGSDSVQFSDANSIAVQYPQFADVRGCVVHHHAAMNVSGTGGAYVDAARDWALSGNLTKTTDTTLTINGSLFQVFKAQNAAKTASCDFQGSATATNIVYNKQGLSWSKPVSGSVQLISPYKTITITFANGTAHIVVTAKDGTVTRDVTITL